MALEEMEPDFGCVGPRNVGKGKAFAHSVASEFPQFFKLQEKRFKFGVYALLERAECDDGEACGNDDLGYSQPSPGTKRTVATESRHGSKGAGCMAHNCLRGPISNSALCTILRPSPCGERSGQHGCVHRCVSCDVKVAARRDNDVAERGEEKSAIAAFSASIATRASRCASLRSLLWHHIREERTVCNKAQRWWIVRRGLGSVASQFLLHVDGHQSDLLSSTFPSRAPLFELLLSHAYFSMKVVAPTGDASPVSRSFFPAIQIRGTQCAWSSPLEVRVSRQTSTLAAQPGWRCTSAGCAR